jgi:pimeloyl-ACP methyl ester carboxylesterase
MLALGAALALLLAAVVLVPGVRAVAKAPFVLGDVLGAPLPRPWAPPVERTVAEVGRVVVDRYSPGSAAPPVLVVPGAAPAGRDDPRVVSLATAVARAGRQVVVPELALYRQRLDLDDVDRVVQVAEALCPPGGGLVLVGFSYGGSLALVAAADERVAACIDLVATFGAYADLVGVVQAAATGVSVVDGVEHPWRGVDESLARRVLYDAAGEFVPAEQRDPLRRALAERDPGGLSPAGRVVYEMVTTEDPERVRTLAERLPPRGAAVVEAFSPVAVSHRVSARVLAAHAVGDPAVPYAELLRLRQAFPAAETMTVRSFDHVDPAAGGGPGTRVVDGLTAVEFVHDVLRPQERWPWEPPT